MHHCEGRGTAWLSAVLLVTWTLLPLVRSSPAGDVERGGQAGSINLTFPLYQGLDNHHHHNHHHHHHHNQQQHHHNHHIQDSHRHIKFPLPLSHNAIRCVKGELLRDSTCACYPCWEGNSCETYVDNYAPRFLVHAATVVLSPNATGAVFQAWSSDEDLGLTCPLGPGDSARCPCAGVTYQLFTVQDDRHFLIDPVSGILTRNNETQLTPGASYTYKLMVQGTPEPGQMRTLFYDMLDLKIYVSRDYVKKIPWT